MQIILNSMATLATSWSSKVSLLFILLSQVGHAQLIHQETLKSEKSIVSYSLDRTGNIYLSFKDGLIVKYNAELDSLNSFSPVRVDEFKLLEAWHGFQVFAFNQKFQDFILFDRFLSRETRYSLGESGVLFVALATVSSDQNLWLLEENGLRLIKYDFKTREVILDVAIQVWLENIDHSFKFIREYQNLLFLVDENGDTYVFDNLGNYLKKYLSAKNGYLSFSGENSYFLESSFLVEKNLYNEHITKHQLDDSEYLAALVFNKNLYLIKEKQVDRYLLPKN